jgi:uncharacterized membrane protein
MARRSQRKRSEFKNRSLGAFLVVLGVILIGLLIGGAWWIRHSTPAVDAETNCPVNGPKVVNVLIFDRSDPISGQQAQRVRFAVDELKRAANFGYRFDIYTFEGDTKAALEPVLKICSPGRPEEANEVFQNPDFVRKKYEERFSSMLDRAIDGLLKASIRDNSPIIESLRAATLTSFGPITDGQAKLHVLLVSDMVQHSAQYSQFKADANFPQLARTPGWAGLRPNLKGADVEVLYLQRPSAKRASVPIQSRGHQMFWEQLVQDGNGIITKFEPI